MLPVMAAKGRLTTKNPVPKTVETIPSGLSRIVSIMMSVASTSEDEAANAGAAENRIVSTSNIEKSFFIDGLLFKINIIVKL